MNYIKHLNTFFQKSTDDARLRPAHISLYMALFQIWNLNRFEESMTIFRNELMKISKISSNATYHKCITELCEFGYIDYLPSYNPLKGSMVKMKEMGNDDNKRHFDQLSNYYPQQSATTELEETAESEEPMQPEVETCSSMQTIEEAHQFQIETCVGTGAGLVEEPELVPNTNVLNYTKHLNVSLKKTAPKAVKIFSDSPAGKKVFCAAAPKSESQPRIAPELAQVQAYCSQQGFLADEAEKFFYYYAAKGWLMGSNTRITDWQAAAHCWMLNHKNTQNHASKHSSNSQPATHNRQSKSVEKHTDDWPLATGHGGAKRSFYQPSTNRAYLHVNNSKNFRVPL